MPKPLLTLIVLVITVAVGVSTATAFMMPIRGVDLLRFAILAACAWAAIELTRHIERKREFTRSSVTAYIDTKAVWSFAAVIVLPPVFASIMVVLTYGLAWLRVQPHNRTGLLYRWVFSCATVLCGTHAAVAVLALGMSGYPGAPGDASLAGLADLGVVTLAAVLRWGINTALVMVAIALANPTVHVRDLFSNFSEQLLEAGAMGLGLVAAAVVVGNPFVLPGIVIAMVALHRGLLVHQYQRASRFDAKTGLASAGWWHEFAEQTLAHARDHQLTMGLLIIDIDHFKRFNDTYGHTHGDRVLRAVAQEIIAEVRDQDACGRWGGEEFAVVLPDVGDSRNLRNVAERIRRRVQSVVVEPADHDGSATSSVTVSLGGAIYPSAGISGLDELLLSADTALYAAKNAGRNTVRLGGVEAPAAEPERRSLPQQAEPPSASA
ncbi:sensor domain-containing diguanylate cyclase [Jiangella aurantiaca]|uniref:GGDEF domain-containing protein n=1 Tax=Jiangella aurantiaca TaxID=2530373 RepID=UPI00193DBB8A|nr:GGDEF domain-containing protein [Jiangella aurantiaca]